MYYSLFNDTNHNNNNNNIIIIIIIILLVFKTLDRLQELLIAAEHLSLKDCIWEIVIDTAIVFFKIYIILNVI